MKAVRYHETGGPEVLKYEEAPTPRPGEGEVLIRVRACALNRIDIWLRSGTYKRDLPHIPGSEFSGDVAEVGPSGDRRASGQKAVPKHINHLTI